MPIPLIHHLLLRFEEKTTGINGDSCKEHRIHRTKHVLNQ